VIPENKYPYLYLRQLFGIWRAGGALFQEAWGYLQLEFPGKEEFFFQRNGVLAIKIPRAGRVLFPEAWGYLRLEFPGKEGFFF